MREFIQLFEFGGTFIIRSMRCRAYPAFLSPVVSRRVTLLHILHQIDARKYKNAMPKSRQNNSSFLSVVG